jgi:AcrR family transcriptional regulator
MLQVGSLSFFKTGSMMAGETAVKRLAVRRRILAAAKHRFARFGYDGTSFADILRSADVSEADMSEHFEDKAGILLAILEEGWSSINPRLVDSGVNSASARDAMLSILTLMMSVLRNDEDLARLLLCEGRRPDPDSSEIRFSTGYRRFMQLCTELVVRGQQDGSFRTSYRPQVVASMLIGAVEGLMRERLVAEQEGDAIPYAGTYAMPVFEALVSNLKP